MPIEKDKIYTHKELEQLGLARAREGFGDGDIFLGENHGYIMNRKNDEFVLFLKYARSS
jgi:hypothetical protein